MLNTKLMLTKNKPISFKEYFEEVKTYLGMIHISRPWKLSKFQDLSPTLSFYVQNFPPLLTLNVQFQTNLLLKRKSKDDYYMLLGTSFRSFFVLSINSLILSGLPLTSLLLAEALMSDLLLLYTLACAVVQNYHEMSFIYHYSYF